MVPFNRPPRHHRGADRTPVVDALRDAAEPRDALWHRRLSDPDALTLQFGLDSSAAEPVTLNIAGELGAVVAGSARFRYALARTLLLEATTVHGPADIDVVVATRPELLANWDWAKWLPHTRQRSTPSLLSTDADYDEWLAERAERTRGLIQSHLTVIVVDAPELWLRRESPMRATLLTPPSDLRVLALCASSQMAPAICSSIIEETGHGRARFESIASGNEQHDVHPALAEITTATEVARHLAPLDDNARPAPDDREHDLAAEHLEVHHAAFGRPLSPLERRLDRRLERSSDRVT
jgi:S-DNA-T family DNA segregation ATPase FtsK/SpoIIIE